MSRENAELSWRDANLAADIGPLFPEPQNPRRTHPHPLPRIKTLLRRISQKGGRVKAKQRRARYERGDPHLLLTKACTVQFAGISLDGPRDLPA